MQRARVRERVTAAGDTLTKAERRVAAVVVDTPEQVAFGTVAEVARAAQAGVGSVVRLASKLGYDGFSSLQDAVQADLADALRPAAARIRDRHVGGEVQRHLALEATNVERTLTHVDTEAVAEIAMRLAELDHDVVVLSGDASIGVCQQLVTDLSALRARVVLGSGNAVSVARTLSYLDRGDVVLAVDLRRYDAWLVEAVRHARRAAAYIVAISDSDLSPIAAVADRSLVVAAGGAGPFDSHVGTLALANLLVAATADQLRDRAVARLDAAETAWREGAHLADS